MPTPPELADLASSRQTKLVRLAAALQQASEKRRPIPPPSQSDPTLTLDDAYSVQLLQIAWRIAAGSVVRGYKVGLTARAMQKQLGVDQPDFGHLTAEMFYADQAPIAVSQFIRPRIEPEIAFVIGSELAGPGVDLARATRAVDCVLAALELIDSRIVDWRISLVDTVADNASSAGVILGTKPLGLAKLDPSSVTCDLHLNSRLMATGTGAAVLGSPLNALVWLANTLGERGIAFQPGDVILPGSLTAAFPVNAGSLARAEFSALGPVSASFT